MNIFEKIKIFINGNVGKITTTSGNVNISGNCTDKISTTSGNVTIIGA